MSDPALFPFELFIRRLLVLPPSELPILSGFLNLQPFGPLPLPELEQQADVLRRTLPGNGAEPFDLALAQIRAFLETKLQTSARSVAFFVRLDAESPVFETMQFEVPIDPGLYYDPLPQLYPLVELKDTYHRFVTVLANGLEARILETTIGSVTEAFITQRPDLSSHIGREWTREHYRNRLEHSENRFIAEMIEIVDQLMARNAHNHLVVAGSPKIVDRFTESLPGHLRDKLISALPVDPDLRVSPVLREAMERFVAAETQESNDRVEALYEAICRTGLATAGFDSCREAILSGSAACLIVDQDHADLAEREILVRLALKHGVEVETVGRNDTLRVIGGLGCLLRHVRPRPGKRGALGEAA